MFSILESFRGFLSMLSNFGDSSRALITITSAAGLVIFLFYSIYIAFKLIQVFRLYVSSQFCCKTNFVKKYGKWAVISGSGDGIGRAMAQELAKRGMSIVVIDWDEDKLILTRALLEQISEVGQVETLKADLSDWSDENFNKIEAQIKPDQRDIGVLINNVGTLPLTYRHIQFYTTGSISLMTNLNALATVNLTRMILPGMVQRERGLILNVASLAGSVPWPYMSVYAPTKAFVESFTRQLQMECRSTQIDVVLLKPGPVLTKLSDPKQTKEPTFILLSPEEFAKSAIGALVSGVKVYSGTLVHGMFRVVLETISKLGLFHLIGDLVKRVQNEHELEDRPLNVPHNVEDQTRDLALLKLKQATNAAGVSIETTQKT